MRPLAISTVETCFNFVAQSGASWRKFTTRYFVEVRDIVNGNNTRRRVSALMKDKTATLSLSLSLSLIVLNNSVSRLTGHEPD